MMRMIGRVMAVAIASFASGCFPATTTVTPGIHGRVVDALGRGVPNAVVNLSDRPNVFGPPPFRVTTDGEGNFKRPEVDGWFLYIIPGDIFPMDMLVQARTGTAASEPREVVYQPAMRPFGFGGRVNIDLGIIEVFEPMPAMRQSNEAPR